MALVENVFLVARERFELSSAGPEPAMLGHYSRREERYLPSTGLICPGYLEKRFTLLINFSLQLRWKGGHKIHVAALKILNSSQHMSLIEQHGRNLFQMRTTLGHMCLRRNR